MFLVYYNYNYYYRYIYSLISLNYGFISSYSLGYSLGSDYNNINSL